MIIVIWTLMENLQEFIRKHTLFNFFNGISYKMFEKLSIWIE